MKFFSLVSLSFGFFLVSSAFSAAFGCCAKMPSNNFAQDFTSMHIPQQGVRHFSEPFKRSNAGRLKDSPFFNLNYLIEKPEEVKGLLLSSEASGRRGEIIRVPGSDLEVVFFNRNGSTLIVV